MEAQEVQAVYNAIMEHADLAAKYVPLMAPFVFLIVLELIGTIIRRIRGDER